VAQAGAGTDYAAGLCKAYNAGGFTDWYLPAKNELAQCYNSLQIVNEVLGDTNGFHTSSYWSSTEVNSNTVTCPYFYDGSISFGIKFDTSPAVRAVRRF
jgi:hypothetical protein